MMKIAFEEALVPDTSVIIERTLSKFVEQRLIKGRLYIPDVYVAYFENLARGGSALGLLGLEELLRVRELATKGGDLAFEVFESGIKDYTNLSFDRLDAIARDLAKKLGAKLLTHSEVQKKVCQVMGIEAMVLPKPGEDALWFEKYFDESTMSLHIKENIPLMAKRGRPGSWNLSVIGEEPMQRSEIELLVEEIIRRARGGEGVIESERPGVMIVQLKDYRIVIVTPPVGLGYEVTITRPVTKLRIEDYNLPPRLIQRLEEKAEGILIAGAPGMGKTTFAQALAEYYARKGKIVKTVESPRDMRLPSTVAQYSKHYASSKDLHDILLLSRPDYTIFDEMRDDDDFNIYVDLRLAGIGMVGVVHAASPIDAIQRFIRRVDIGMLPSIVDTVIFIDKGRVSKVYELSLTVRLPTGLREMELARPVVEVRDFLTGELEYEVYVFGEQTVVMPVRKLKTGLLADRVTSMVKKAIPYANVTLEENVVTVEIPRAHYSTAVMKMLRKVGRKLDKLGYEVRVQIV